MPTAVRSRAKVNLGLAIGAPRPDGFHPLATVYQTLELHDVVTVSARKASATRLRLTSNDQRVPTDERNTAWKMVSLALEALGLTAEVEIAIDKRLPVQGGLGAGSGNAVAALLGLEAELGIGNQLRGLPPFEQMTLEGWGAQPIAKSTDSEPDQPQKPGAPSFSRSLRKGWESKNLPRSGLKGAALSQAQRMEIAAQVGSDVPLFLIGGTILGLDRGQQVYPLPDLEPLWCVVAVPDVGVSTPQAYRDWDALCAAGGLTPEAGMDKLKEMSRAYAGAFGEVITEGGQGAGSSGVLAKELDGEDLAGPPESALVRTGITSWIENDFERVVFPQHPLLGEIKRILLGFGTPEAGSCLPCWPAPVRRSSGCTELAEMRKRHRDG